MRSMLVLVVFLCFMVPCKSFSAGFIDSITGISSVKSDVDVLKAEVEELKGIIELQKQAISMVYNKVFDIEKVIPNRAEFSPSDQGYSIVFSLGGLFSVSCNNIKPYSTGSEVELEIVNLYSVDVTDVVLNISYSQEDKDYSDIEKMKKHTSGLKSVKKKVDIIKSGCSVLVTFRAPEYKPDTIKYVSVVMSAAGQRYRRSK